MPKNMRLRAKFANLAEEVLREESEALTVEVLIDKVAAKALTKRTKHGKRVGNKYFREMKAKAVHHIIKNDSRFVKTEQEEWRVNLWTLAEE